MQRRGKYALYKVVGADITFYLLTDEGVVISSPSLWDILLNKNIFEVLPYLRFRGFRTYKMCEFTKDELIITWRKNVQQHEDAK